MTLKTLTLVELLDREQRTGECWDQWEELFDKFGRQLTTPEQDKLLRDQLDDLVLASRQLAIQRHVIERGCA
jgi:hypothetical protein